MTHRICPFIMNGSVCGTFLKTTTKGIFCYNCKRHIGNRAIQEEEEKYQSGDATRSVTPIKIIDDNYKPKLEQKRLIESDDEDETEINLPNTYLDDVELNRLWPLPAPVGLAGKTLKDIIAQDKWFCASLYNKELKNQKINGPAKILLKHFKRTLA